MLTNKDQETGIKKMENWLNLACNAILQAWMYEK